MLRILLFCALALASPTFAAPSGPVRVIDGDTLDVGGTRVRLHAIDAPETDQMCGTTNSPAWACGDWVTSRTIALFDGKLAECDALDRDRYGRVVARCDVDGRDVGDVLVRQGLAFAYRTYGLTYVAAEQDAANAGRGLHATGIASPATFRASQRAGARTVRVAPEAQPASDAPRRRWLPAVLDPSCKIKGNISRNGGQRIYHMPGQDYYEATQITLSKGERWFCSEHDARAAGWRKARK